jgi:hypothetical protein
MKGGDWLVILIDTTHIISAPLPPPPSNFSHPFSPTTIFPVNFVYSQFSFSFYFSHFFLTPFFLLFNFYLLLILKGIVQPFELGGVTRLIPYAVKFCMAGN